MLFGYGALDQQRSLLGARRLTLSSQQQRCPAGHSRHSQEVTPRFVVGHHINSHTSIMLIVSSTAVCLRRSDFEQLGIFDPRDEIRLINGASWYSPPRNRRGEPI